MHEMVSFELTQFRIDFAIMNCYGLARIGWTACVEIKI